MAKKTKEPARRAAIDFEEIEDTPLSEITADRFLEALDQENLLPLLRVWPEKKKYELFHEPENIGRVPMGRLRDILKGEKKKRELEPHPDVFDGSPLPLPFDQKQYDRLVDRLTTDLERRLGDRLKR